MIKINNINCITTLNSGSSGNCYLLECNNEVLIIELGVSWKEVLKGLNYDLSKVVGCLVSHEHLDHSKYIPTLLKCGISVYSCKSVQTMHPQVKVLKKGSKYKIGGFSVQPIPTPHSVECYAFLIEHNDIGKCLFITDTSAFHYRIKNCNHIFIEANWSEDILIDKLCNDDATRSRHEQHLEIGQTIDVLKQNYSSDLQTIMLLHLSNGNSNAQQFKERVQQELGFLPVYVAEEGLTLELQKEEF